jgi:SAM-dependent methyltransferase
MGMFVMALCVGVGAVFVMQWGEKSSVRTLSSSRNFYGTLKVFDYYPGDEEDNYHLLLHGATTHGIQFVKPEKSVMPTTYYSDRSGVGRAINSLPESPRRIGLVGLGTGTLAAYGRKGDYLRIYEINPTVEQLARTHFKYLDYCQARVDVVMGDARLMMERELEEKKAQEFDLLALDAFSSDAIPVHLLTKEAMEIYLRQLKPDGVLAVHISNRYLNLQPVVEKLAAHFGLEVVTISDDNEPDWWIYATTWMLVTRNKEIFANDRIRDATDEPETGSKTFPLWTDDFASVYSILKRN